MSKHIKVFTVEYLQSKKLSWFSRFGNNWVMPEDYVLPEVPNSLYDQVFTSVLTSDLRTIKRCAFDLSDIRTMDDVITLAISLMWYKYKSTTDYKNYYNHPLHPMVQYQHYVISMGCEGTHRFYLKLVDNNDEGAYRTGILFLARYAELCREGPFLARILRYLTYDNPPDLQNVPQDIRTMGDTSGHMYRLVPTATFYGTVGGALMVFTLDELMEKRNHFCKMGAIEERLHRQTIELLQVLGYKADEIEYILRCVTFHKHEKRDYSATRSARTDIGKLVDAIESSHQIPVTSVKNRLKSDLKLDQEKPCVVTLGGRKVCIQCILRSREHCRRIACPYHQQADSNCSDSRPLEPHEVFLGPDIKPVASAPPLEEGTQCDICMAKPKNIVFLPCKHTCCSECAGKLRECHMCRGPIIGTITM